MAKPKRAHLERDLIVAQQQRDRAIDRAERAEAELAQLRRQRTVQSPSMSDRLTAWLDEMRQAVGL